MLSLTINGRDVVLDGLSPSAATRESMLRAYWLANSVPKGPVYINLDAEMQEARLPEPLPPIDVARFIPPIATAASSCRQSSICGFSLPRKLTMESCRPR